MTTARLRGRRAGVPEMTRVEQVVQRATVTSATGHFRFFAGEGDWTLRTLAPQVDPVDNLVHASVGSVAEVTVAL